MYPVRNKGCGDNCGAKGRKIQSTPDFVCERELCGGSLAAIQARYNDLGDQETSKLFQIQTRRIDRSCDGLT